jgi:hypothetical protein
MMATCPICKSEVEVIEDQIGGAAFRCPKHQEFGVAGIVFSVPEFMNGNSTRWERALQIAKKRATPGERPKISSYDF